MCKIDDGVAARRVDEGGVDLPVKDIRDRPGTVRRQQGIDTHDEGFVHPRFDISIIHPGRHLIIECEYQVIGMFVPGFREDVAHRFPGVFPSKIRIGLDSDYGSILGPLLLQDGDKALIPFRIRSRSPGAPDQGNPLPAIDNTQRVESSDAADLTVVASDESGIFVAVHLAVVQDHRDACVIGLLDDGRKGGGFVRRNDQQINPFINKLLNICNLLLRIVPDGFELEAKVIIEQGLLPELVVRRFPPGIHAALGYTNGIYFRFAGAGQQGQDGQTRQQERSQQSLHQNRTILAASCGTSFPPCPENSSACLSRADRHHP